MEKKESQSKQKLKELLGSFLKEDGVGEIINSCQLIGDANWLNTAITVKITEVGKNKVNFRIDNNAREGFSQFQKEYKIIEDGK